jgi:diacylglycerol kinase (ATP)
LHPPSTPHAIEADRVIILRNPKAGARDTSRDVDCLAELLRKQSYGVAIHTDLELAARDANALAEQGELRVLVGVGGDGTAAELVNRTKPGTPLTWLPRGNCNLLARHLHLDNSPEGLAQTIAQGSIIHLDAGMASGRIFLIMASCGVDAEVVRLVHQCRTGHLTSRTYFIPILEALRTYEYPEIKVCWDEALDGGKQTACRTACWFSVFNLPCYGGGFHFATQAVGSDGLLDLCGLRKGKFFNFLRYVCTVYLRQQHRMSDWFTCQVRRVQITSDAPVPYQLDGDPGGYLPLDIEILPNRLTMLVPKK